MFRWAALGALVLLALVALALLLGPFLVDPKSQAEALPTRLEEPGRSHFVKVEFPGTHGLEIHYLEAAGPDDATTPPFLLLHGFTLNAFSWDPQLPVFGAHARVVAYDQLPYGLSAKPTADDWRGPNPYDKAAALAQVVTLMDALGLPAAILVGNSSGGTLALELALTHPQRVAGLILVAPWVYVQRPVLPRAMAELPQLRRLSLFAARRLGANGGLLEYSYADASRLTAERRRRADLHTRTRHWDLAWGELLNRSLSSPVTVAAHLPAIRQPALIVTGDADRLVPPADTRRVAEALPNASLRVLGGCGHVPQEECPEAFAEAVNAWLAGEFGAAPASRAVAAGAVQ